MGSGDTTEAGSSGWLGWGSEAGELDELLGPGFSGEGEHEIVLLGSTSSRRNRSSEVVKGGVILTSCNMSTERPDGDGNVEICSVWR